MTLENRQTVPVRWIALPVEHGGWGLLLEPALVAMILAPSWAGLWLSLAALSVFLINRPLKIFLQELRSRWVIFFISLYGILALTAFAAVFLLVRAPFWLPMLLALPLALVQFFHITLKQSRNLIPELCGGVALGAIAPCVLIAGGWGVERALFVWLVLGVRTLTAVIYIRNKLRAARGTDFSGMQVLWVHLAGVALLGSLAFYAKIPWLAFVGFLFLCFHALWGISRKAHTGKPRRLGMEEMLWGILNSLFIIAGYLFRRGAV